LLTNFSTMIRADCITRRWRMATSLEGHDCTELYNTL